MSKKKVTLQEFLDATVQKKMEELTREGGLIVKTDITRVTNLRFSGFPFCGVRWFLSLPEALHATKRQPFGMSFFVNVGTAVHNVIQESWDSIKGAEVYNDFHCKKCHHVHSLVQRPDKCENCGSKELVKHEHEVFFENAVGHIDEMLYIELPDHVEPDFPVRAGFVVIDYKTTMLKKVLAKTGLPSKENVLQISGYAAALRKQKKPIIGYCLVYVPRDNPFAFLPISRVLNKQEYKECLDRMYGYVDMFEAWSKAKSKKRVIMLTQQHRPCTPGNEVPSEFEGCQYCSLCTSLDGEEILEERINRVYDEVADKLPIEKLRPTDKRAASRASGGG